MGKLLVIKGADFSNVKIGEASIDEDVIHPYTVTFDDNYEGGNTHVIQTISGWTVLPYLAKRNGYTLVGWCTDSELTTAFNFSTPITSNITLYAKWSEDETSDVQYYSDMVWTEESYFNGTSATVGYVYTSTGSYKRVYVPTDRCEIELQAGQHIRLSTRSLKPSVTPSPAVCNFFAVKEDRKTVIVEHNTERDLFNSPFEFTATEHCFFLVNVCNGKNTEGVFNAEDDCRGLFYCEIY